MHHEHTECDPICHHVIDNWQSARTNLETSLQQSSATISIKTIDIGNSGTYQNVQWDGSVLMVELKPPSSYSQVTFNEDGLNPNKSWSVTLDGRTLSTNRTTLTVTLPNGTYVWTITPPFGYEGTPNSGTVQAGRNNIIQDIRFNTTAADGSQPRTILNTGPSIFSVFSFQLVLMALLVTAGISVGVRRVRHRPG